MKRFLKKIALFSIPFIVYLLLIVAVDPYNYLNRDSLIGNDVRAHIAHDVEPHLFKLINYDNHPKKNIALGDSRTNSLFHSMSDSWANLAYDGGSLKEIIETFWYTDEHVKLDTVLLSVNLRMYNRYHKRFWVEETIERKKNFFSYAFSKYAFRSTLYVLQSAMTGNEVELQTPAMTPEEFWKYQLEKTAPKFFVKHAHPDAYYEDLKKIAEHCKKKGIVLIFWIPPTHVDFQQRIADFDLLDDQARFVREMEGLGTLYNFNIPSDITMNKNNYTDPVHFNKEVGKVLYDKMFGE